VITSLRADRAGRHYIRLSPHFYNTDAELDRCLELLQWVAGEAGVPFFTEVERMGLEGVMAKRAQSKYRAGRSRDWLKLKADLIAEHIHFFPDDPPRSIAHKALRVNLSDLAAKGATPVGYLLSLALKEDWTEDWIAGFASGLAADQARYGVTLFGGDTSRAAGGTVDEVTPAQPGQFSDATRGLRQWYVQRYGSEWLERLDAAVAACEVQYGGVG
jgi:hypothetical protein